MAWSVCTLLLTAVALMASRASVPAGPDSEQGRAATRTLTRFVCAKCSATGQLSSRGLFLSRAAVHRHIAASKPWSAAKMGIREIQVDVRTSDVLAEAGGAAGSAPVVRHQPEGTSGGKPMHTACTLCTLCTLFKSCQSTENKTLEFRSRKGGDGIRPFKLTGIRRESLKLGRKGGAFNV
jgi:hypothetical protein